MIDRRSRRGRASYFGDSARRYDTRTFDPMSFTYTNTSGRTTTVTTCLPLNSTENPLPICVFSHGLGGDRNKYQPLRKYCAERGIGFVQPDHLDSALLGFGQDFVSSPWYTRQDEHDEMITNLATWLNGNPTIAAIINGRSLIIGAAGHSYGGHTTVGVGGAVMNHPQNGSREIANPLIKSLLCYSPPGVQTMDTAGYCASLVAPLGLLTGTNDPGANGTDGVIMPYTWREQPFIDVEDQFGWLMVGQGTDHGYGGMTGGYAGNEFATNISDAAWEQIAKDVGYAHLCYTLRGDQAARAALLAKYWTTASVGKINVMSLKNVGLA